MKIKSTLRIVLASTLAVGALHLACPPLQAQTFAYTNCDLLAGFQVPGEARDLVVDLGTVGYYLNLPWRSVVALTNVSAAQLADTLSPPVNPLPTLAHISWSVSAAMRGNPNYPQVPLQTIWVTAPQPGLYTPGPVWKLASVWDLGGTASQIDAIGNEAAAYGNGQPAGPYDTTSGILIPPASQYAYSYIIGLRGNFDNTFQGDARNTTPDDFDTAGLPSRSTLYELQPATGSAEGTPGAVIGFFDFETNGTLVFTAGPPPEPTSISTITRQGNVTTLWFPSVNLVGYRLRYTDSAGLATPISSWNIGSTNIGTGAILSLADSNSTPLRFYVIESF